MTTARKLEPWLRLCYWAFPQHVAAERPTFLAEMPADWVAGYGFSRAVVLAAYEPEYFAALCRIARESFPGDAERERWTRAYVEAHPVTQDDLEDAAAMGAASRAEQREEEA